MWPKGLLEALAAYDLTGARILIARAAVARDVLPWNWHGAARRWMWWRPIEPFRPPDLGRARAPSVLAPKPDWITFTSSSTVQNLLSKRWAPKRSKEFASPASARSPARRSAHMASR